MRLWHDKLIPYLPNKQLLGQHRECCALRGKGWDMNMFVVNYVFQHSQSKLYIYHSKVMKEMKARGFNVEEKWLDSRYRGQNLPPLETEANLYASDFVTRYSEHDDMYLLENLLNLKSKGITIEVNLFKDKKYHFAFKGLLIDDGELNELVNEYNDTPRKTFIQKKFYSWVR